MSRNNEQSLNHEQVIDTLLRRSYTGPERIGSMCRVSSLTFWLLASAASVQRAPLPPIAGRLVTHLSISDFPQVWGSHAHLGAKACELYWTALLT